MVLTPTGYKPRLIDPLVSDYLQSFGAVSIEGPKYCGKTWTALNHSNSSFMIADPSFNYSNRNRAKMDVSSIFEGEEPRLIDEWQEIPSIWDATRFEVDKNAKKGRIILTGSSTPVKDEIIHSGAGRIGSLKMRTMSLYESGHSDGRVSLQSLFDSDFKNSFTDDRISLEKLCEMIARGGWPGNMDIDINRVPHNLEDYIRKIASDATKVSKNTISEEKMRMVIKSLARNESTIASNSTIAKDTELENRKGLDPRTVSKYTDLLRQLYIIEDTPAFDPNFRSPVRIGLGGKRHLTDPSLAVSALGMNPKKLIRDLNTTGFMFEAMCERDLDIYAKACGGTLYHYRDREGREIDAIVEMPDGQWGAFEIKLGTNQIDDASEELLKINEYFKSKGIRRTPSFLCVICGLECNAYRREDGVYVVPITALRN